MSKLTVSETLLLNEIFESGTALIKSSKGLEFGQTIYLIRKNLCMSQQTLAKRSGIPQPQISKIEKGSLSSNYSTLKKISDALFCDIVISPIPKKDLSSIKQNIAEKIARKRIYYILGTMSLEKQSPDDQMIRAMLKKEEENIINNFDSKIWNEINE